MGRVLLALCLLAGGGALCGSVKEAPEVAVSLDVRDAEIRTIVQALAELGNFQVLFDPALECRLTLNVRQQRLAETLDLTLRACGLAAERDGHVLRVTTPARLTEEARGRTELRKAQARARPVTTTVIRLAYARAQEMAPLVEKLLSPRGRVVLDARTNTLLIVD